MKTQIEVSLEKFTTPNFVRIKGDKERAFPLKDVDEKSLSILCDYFREEVFAKAKKKDPRLK
jgi:hypothetical protein